MPFELQSGNPFLDSNFDSNSHHTLPDTSPRLCATAYQHQAAFFQLPASRPYDNFLKAAGCWFMVEKMVILIVEFLDKTLLTLVDIEDARKSCTSCFLDHDFTTIFMVGSVCFLGATIIDQPCSLNYISSLICFLQGGVSFIGILANFSELFLCA